MTPEFEIAKLELREGDTLVVRVQGIVRSDARDRIAAYAKPAIPDGVKIMVIDASIELNVLQKV